MQKYSIGEVCKLLGVKPHVLRYWEQEISLLSPRKSDTGRKVYTDHDLQLLFRLKFLLYDKRFTIEGARERIWKEAESSQADVSARIAAVRSDLLTAWEKLKKGK